MPSITNLAIITIRTVVENEMAKVSNLVKTTDYNTKINESKKKLLMLIIVLTVLLRKNLISQQQKILLHD